MSPNQRRKRRSYSCGPCNKLKLKCDLQIPCRSCERSRRADKCLEDPPQPPSEEELERIANRRRKKTQWKQRNSAISETEVSIVIDTSHPPMETSSPLDSKYVPPQHGNLKLLHQLHQLHQHQHHQHQHHQLQRHFTLHFLFLESHHHRFPFREAFRLVSYPFFPASILMVRLT